MGVARFKEFYEHQRKPGNGLRPPRPLPSQEELCATFNYDPESGLLTWAYTRRFNAPAGSVAGALTPAGYLRLKYDHHSYMAHRIVWKMFHGNEPDEIDHINNVRSDNRIENLRAAMREDNQANRLLGPNALGLKGAHYRKGKDWCVSVITHKGRSYYLGTFRTAEDAHEAYMRAALELFGEFANSGAGGER